MGWMSHCVQFYIRDNLFHCSSFFLPVDPLFIITLISCVCVCVFLFCLLWVMMWRCAPSINTWLWVTLKGQQIHVKCNDLIYKNSCDTAGQLVMWAAHLFSQTGCRTVARASYKHISHHARISGCYCIMDEWRDHM